MSESTATNTGSTSRCLAEVAVARPLPTPLTYAVPEPWQALIAPGSRVLVPLGGGSCEGIVTAVRTGPPPTGMRLRTLSELLGDRPELTPELLELAGWLAEHYVTTLGEALAQMLLPYRPPRTETLLRLVAGRTGRVRPGTHGERLVRWLEEHGGVASVQTLRSELGPAAAAATGLTARGVLVRETRLLQAEPHLAARAPGNAPFPELTSAQASVSSEIAGAIDSGEPSVHLIRGVTGSGKTEVYLRLARHVLDSGGGVLFLVPEISLTVPMISLFRERFGAALALFHSALTETERHREWLAARDGTARIIVGARSAVFAPVEGLRLIVLDEEPESSYKQHERPCYHARDVAIARGRIGRFPIVLGSATPSLESAHAAATGRSCCSSASTASQCQRSS
jgi:primosomal protein N' (replication factor Y)